jgi:hypothetical protein
MLTIESSCPALCRASTSYFPWCGKDVDGRDKPGNDGVDINRNPVSERQSGKGATGIKAPGGVRRALEFPCSPAATLPAAFFLSAAAR